MSTASLFFSPALLTTPTPHPHVLCPHFTCFHISFMCVNRDCKQSSQRRKQEVVPYSNLTFANRPWPPLPPPLLPMQKAGSGPSQQAHLCQPSLSPLSQWLPLLPMQEVVPYSKPTFAPTTTTTVPNAGSRKWSLTATPPLPQVCH